MNGAWIEGEPMAKLGLEKAEIVYPDGYREPLSGLFVKEGDTVAGAIERQLPPGTHLEIDHHMIGHA